jgi:hypothetical protein
VGSNRQIEYHSISADPSTTEFSHCRRGLTIIAVSLYDDLACESQIQTEAVVCALSAKTAAACLCARHCSWMHEFDDHLP